MAKLTIKGGFTRIPNNFLEALMTYPVSGLKMGIILFLIRHSYGYQRKTAELSLSEISSNLKKTKAKVAVALKELIGCRVIKVVKKFDPAHHSRTLAVNMNPSLWLKEGCPDGKRLSKRETVPPMGYSSVSQPGNSTVIHPGNRNGQKSPENKGRNYTPKKSLKKEKKVYSPGSLEFSLSNLLLSLIIQNKKTFKQPDLQKWCLHMERMIKADKRSPEEIEKVIRWCQNDDFWFSKVTSTESLRQKFDRLGMEMESIARRNKTGIPNNSNVSESDRIRL